MKAYLDLLDDVVTNGTASPDRTGTGKVSVFGRHFAHDFKDGFPLLTTKRVHWKSVVGELLWFLSGSSNIKELRDQGISIWDEWATEDGDLGPVYGVQWRSWRGPNNTELDQISELIHNLKNNPYSRRHVVSAWNAADLPIESRSPQENVLAGRMALAPCHCLFQFCVAPANELRRYRYMQTLEGTTESGLRGVSHKELHLHMYQRSADLFLGVPFNIASYALLTYMVAQQCDMVPASMAISFGDLHLYKNHITKDIVFEQLCRVPRKLPRVILNSEVSDIFSYKLDDIQLLDYNPDSAIRAQISV